MQRLPILMFSLVLAAPAPLAAQALQLADGKLLIGSVEDPDGQGLRVRRHDNGGVLDLRWEHLSPACALTVKKQFGLVGDAQDELTIRVEEVEVVRNGGVQTLLGFVDNSGPNIVVEQKGGAQITIPRADVRTIRQIDVPVTQVLTKEQFYSRRLGEMQPGSSADKHVLLAEDLLRVRDYDRALEHLNKAKELGNSRAPERIEPMVARVQRYREAAKERELSDQIVAARSRATIGDFEKGRKLIAQYQKEFAAGKLQADFEKEKNRFEEARTRYLALQVADGFRRSIHSVAEARIADQAVSLQAAREYADTKMTDDLFEKVGKQLRLDTAEVKQLWTDRAKYPAGKRTEHFSYGIGTWVLGEKAAIKDTQVGKQAAANQQQPQGSANQQQIQAIAKKLEEAMRRRAASQAAGQQPQEQTDEDWWREAPRVERAGWLRAYYAESGGQLVVTFATVTPCMSCQGQGTTPVLAPNGQMQQDECFFCHGTKWLRSFKAY